MLAFFKRLAPLIMFSISLTCASAPQIEVTAELAEPDGEPILRFVLKNIGTESIAIPRGFLPWSKGIFGAPISARLMEFPYTELRQSYGMTNPVGTTAVEPGASQTGDVSLRRRLEGLEKMRKKGKIIVFWHWVPMLEAGESLEPKAGWLVLPGTH